MVSVALVDLGWWARKMGALIKKSREKPSSFARRSRTPPPRTPATSSASSHRGPGDDAGRSEGRRGHSRNPAAPPWQAWFVSPSPRASTSSVRDRSPAPARKRSLRSTSANRRASCSVWATNVALSPRLPAKRSIRSPATGLSRIFRFWNRPFKARRPDASRA
jgi:hypothetical protein